MIGIEKVRNRIYLKPEGNIAQRCLRLGGSWLEKSGQWSFPCEMHVCLALRREFGDSLEIGPELWAWAKAEKEIQAKAEAIHELAMAKPVSLPNVEKVAPTMYAAMMDRGYQTIAAKFGATVGSHFNADQPGAGKTIEAFGALIERGIFGRWLVVGPRKALQATWTHEVAKWLAPDLDVHVELALAEEGNMEERNMLIEDFNEESDKHLISILLINPEACRMKAFCVHGACNGTDGFCEYKREHKRLPDMPALFSRAWDAIIADETHRYMMNANERSKTVSQVGLGIQLLPCSDYGMKIGLSGTPFKGKPRRFWPVLHWLQPERYTGRWRWAKRFFLSKPNKWAATGEELTDKMIPGRIDEFDADMARFMIRRTKSELRQLNPEWAPPDKRYAEVWVTMDGKQARQYRAMEEHATAELDGKVLTANGVLAHLTRMKQLAIAAGSINKDGVFKPLYPSAKLDWILEYMDSAGVLDDDGTGKIIIASQYTSVLDFYSKALTRKHIKHLMITGETQHIEAIQAQWQTEPQPRVMLLSTQAGGVSLTLDAADTVIINDETWVPDDQEQVEDRAHRTSRTDHQVDVIYLRTDGTIERDIAGDNEWKDSSQKRVLDARRGIEVAKQKFNVKIKGGS